MSWFDGPSKNIELLIQSEAKATITSDISDNEIANSPVVSPMTASKIMSSSVTVSSSHDLALAEVKAAAAMSHSSSNGMELSVLIP